MLRLTSMMRFTAYNVQEALLGIMIILETVNSMSALTESTVVFRDHLIVPRLRGRYAYRGSMRLLTMIVCIYVLPLPL